MNGGLIKSCELVARVRSGRVVKSGMKGIVMYNAEWLQRHRDTELRGCGSGNPSSEDIRPISGWNGMKVSHSGADTSDPEVVHVSWLAEVGTEYKGILNVATGMLTLKNDEDEEIRKRGVWLDIGGVYKCSVCGCIEEWEYDYCRNCGAKMETEVQE